MNTTFSHQLRILACAQCAAPIDVAIEGGQVVCRYCGAPNQLRPRDERADEAAAKAPATLSEAERFRRLRAQDGQPLLPPPSLAHVFVGGGLPPHNQQVAQTAWQQARQELGAAATSGFPGGNHAAEERLYFLTKGLYALLLTQQQDRAVRGLLETARDALTDPVFRQDIHGMLARNAARVGDLAAAEEWLALMYPHSDSLNADTQFRFTFATIATLKHNPQGVLQALGMRIGDIPIHDSGDLICGVIRSNALEKTGQVQEAASQLMQLPMGLPGVEKVVQSNPHMQLCMMSLPAARQMAPRPAAAGGGGGGGGIRWGRLVPWLILPVLFFGYGIAGLLGLTASGGPPPSGAFFMGVCFMIGPAIMILMAKSQQKTQQHFALNGIDAQAQVLSIRETGVRVNHQPQVEFQLRVFAPNMPPYEITHKKVVSMVAIAGLQPGATIQLKVDRTNPKNVLL